MFCMHNLIHDTNGFHKYLETKLIILLTYTISEISLLELIILIINILPFLRNVILLQRIFLLNIKCIMCVSMYNAQVASKS